MKIAFIGGVKASLEYLKHVNNLGFKVEVVFSYDDSKKKFYSDYACFDEITKKYNLTHYKVQNINDKQNIDLLKKIQPDIILVLGWSQLLKSEIIKIAKLGVFGFHPTELPKYRGRAPIPWTILKQLNESALTLFAINEGVDNGDIVVQKKFQISKLDDAEILYQKLIIIGKEILSEILPKMEEEKIPRTKQDESKFIELWPKRTPDDGKINWNQTAEQIHRLIRASTKPYPGAYTSFKNKKFIIWKADCANDQSYNQGEILEVNDYYIEIGTTKGKIRIKEIEIKDNEQNRIKELFSKEDVGKKIE